MKVVSKKSFIQSQLSVIFSSTKHADKDEKEVRQVSSIFIVFCLIEMLSHQRGTVFRLTNTAHARENPNDCLKTWRHFASLILLGQKCLNGNREIFTTFFPFSF